MRSDQGESDQGGGVTRRQSLQWFLAAAAAVYALDPEAFIACERYPEITGPRLGSDPDLLDPVIPWSRTMTPAQLATTAALCEVVIPRDDVSPSAREVGVHEFIDEWISAPYPRPQTDRRVVLDGLAWLEKEAASRFASGFSQLSHGQQRAICDDICFLETAERRFRKAAEFFARFRNLTAGGFYTTAEGMSDLQFIGNVPRSEYPGAPPEVLRHFGL